MASTLRSRLGQTLLACLLAASLAMPLRAALLGHADPQPPLAAAACGAAAAAGAATDAVRVRFWIGAFEFSLALGGDAGFTIAFEGLR